MLEAVRAGALLTGQGGGGEGGGVEYGLNTRTFYHIWLIIFHGLHVLVIPFFQIYFHNDQTFFSSHDGPDGVIIKHIFTTFIPTILKSEYFYHHCLLASVLYATILRDL